jgi:hypothetical protein
MNQPSRIPIKKNKAKNNQLPTKGKIIESINDGKNYFNSNNDFSL